MLNKLQAILVLAVPRTPRGVTDRQVLNNNTNIQYTLNKM